MKLPGAGDGSYGHLGAGAGGHLGGGAPIRSSPDNIDTTFKLVVTLEGSMLEQNKL